MLPADPARSGAESVRFATPDALEEYVAGKLPAITKVDRAAAIEEEYFLGLRLTRGIDPEALSARYGADFRNVIADLVNLGLLEWRDKRVRLTPRGRLLSNEVFQRFLGTAPRAP